MYLVWMGGVLVALKAFEVKYVATLSWWWILAPLGLAMVYFELIEPMFGFDKKKAHTSAERYQAKRKQAMLKSNWNQKNK